MDYIHHGDFGIVGIGAAGTIASLALIAIAWTLLWKGLALWRAANRGDTWWFIAFLLINTLGILEIIYIFAITGAKLSEFTSRLTSKRSASDGTDQ